MISFRRVVLNDVGQNRGVHEVILGQTPLIVPEMTGWLGQKLTGRITRIEESQ